MYCTKSITSDLYWIGGSDRRLNLFENVYPLTNGVSYNSYLLLDEKTVLFDTVDKAVSGIFFENIAHLLGKRKLDYLIVNHMEPDHAATIDEVILRYPEVKIVCNAKTANMIKQFFCFDLDSRCIIVKEMDTLNTGKHTYAFVMMPMVHWPEAMVTYDTVDKILFSADAFGTFGAIDGNLFADEVNFEETYLDEARRYYTNIVGKYSTQVQSILKKAATLEIAMICPLHGPIWRKNLGWFMDKYQKWATYTPEEDAVMIAYGSIYGNTENAANIIASKLADKGIKNIKMYDVSVTHPSVIVSEAFRCSHLIFASSTYNAGIFQTMETALLDIAAHNLQNRTIALVENGTWGPTAGGLMKAILSKCKNMNILEQTLTLKSSLKENQMETLDALVQAVYDSMPKKPEIIHDEKKIEPNAMFKLSYGLFVLTAKDGQKDNGCIINTVTQITDSPKRISIAVNKANYTHDMILKTGVFNVSILTVDAPFKLYEHFGFTSGKDTDKFKDDQGAVRSENGIYYLPESANAFLSGKVIQTLDYGTHTLFIADVTEAKQLSDVPSVTYAYYFANVKPKPQQPAADQKGFICKICGYIYEGDELPDDFICPLCKHGAEDFEKL